MEMLKISTWKSKTKEPKLYLAKVWGSANFYRNDTVDTATMVVTKDQAGVVGNYDKDNLVKYIHDSARNLFCNEMKKEFGSGWIINKWVSEYELINNI